MELPGGRHRLTSVDAFRGLAILTMILVNNPGDWSAVYAPLRHAEWHGCTLADLVFPFFLFGVGVSIVLALDRRVEMGTPRRALGRKILRRSLVLFGLGLFLSGFPFGLFGPRSWLETLETWRILGVLQRIAVCYLAASFLFLFLRKRTLAFWTGVSLVGYWGLLELVPVPGVGAPDLDDPGRHLAGWIDRTVLGDHLWSGGVVYDPEGILSTLAALATTLLGVFAGRVLRSAADRRDRTIQLVTRGWALVATGWVWSWVLPLNKALWTSSYAVFTAGLAMVTLGCLHWILDVETPPSWVGPLVVYGVNAITVFVGSGVLGRVLIYAQVGGRSLKAAIHQSLFAGWLPAHAASLAYALTWVLGWYLVLRWMDRRGLHLKV